MGLDCQNEIAHIPHSLHGNNVERIATTHQPITQNFDEPTLLSIVPHESQTRTQTRAADTRDCLNNIAIIHR